MEVRRGNGTEEGFIQMVACLDADLAERDGQEHDFYAQFNGLDTIKHSIVVYEGSKPVACGAFKPFDSETVEVKRMYTLEECRGKGIASLVLAELEKWAAELNFNKTVLETGLKQPEAINLYQQKGYKKIENYGQYKGVENSVCFEKQIF